MDSFRVLVVDDEADFLETIVKRLLKRGLEAHGVPSGEAALALMKERRFDVVLMDIKMPGGMDGVEVFKGVEEDPAPRRGDLPDRVCQPGKRHGRDEARRIRLPDQAGETR